MSCLKDIPTKWVESCKIGSMWKDVRVMALLLMALLVGLCQSVHTLKCHNGEFVDRSNSVHRCRPCSTCPVNRIVHVPCSGQNDTLCGPFTDFDVFNQHNQIDNSDKLPDLHTADTDSDVGIHAGGREDNMLTIPSDDGEHWRKLAFSLIGVLCALILVATVVVILTYRYFARGMAAKSCSQEDEDDGDGAYVVIHTNRLAATESGQSSILQSTSTATRPESNPHRYHRNNRLYRPKRRLMNEYVDDVFESEDSGGSRSVRVPLHPILERSEPEGSDGKDYVNE